MKKIASVIFLLCFPVFSYANNVDKNTEPNSTINPYVSLKFGYSSNNLKISNPANKDFTNSSFSFNPAIGLSFNTRYFDMFSFRVEAEYLRNTSGSNDYITELQWRTGTNPPYSYHYETRKSIVSTTIEGLMFNAYADMDLGIKITPYAMVGLGYGKIAQENQLITDTFHDSPIVNSDSADYVTYSEKHSAYNMFWQLGLGISFDITEKVALSAEFRHIDYGTLKLYDLDYKRSANQILVGARYAF